MLRLVLRVCLVVGPCGHWVMFLQGRAGGMVWVKPKLSKVVGLPFCPNDRTPRRMDGSGLTNDNGILKAKGSLSSFGQSMDTVAHHRYSVKSTENLMSQG